MPESRRVKEASCSVEPCTPDANAFESRPSVTTRLSTTLATAAVLLELASVVGVHHHDLVQVIEVLEPVHRVELVHRGEPRGDHRPDDAGDVRVADEARCVALEGESEVETASGEKKPVCSSYTAMSRRLIVAISSIWQPSPCTIFCGGWFGRWQYATQSHQARSEGSFSARSRARATSGEPSSA